MSAAVALDNVTEACWRVTREGAIISEIAFSHEHGEIVVAAGGRPYRFDSMQSADAFVTDLLTSFSYLGCDVAQVQR